MMNRSVMQRQMFRKGGAAFPDLSGDGKITQKDILMGRGVIPTPKQYGGAVGMQQGGVAPPMMPPPPPAPAMMPPPPPMPPDPAMMPPPPQMDNLDPAVLEGMMGAAAEGIQSLDQAQDYEQVMNTIRGDEASIGERRDELASVVGERDADQTPESVLTLVQPVMQMAQSGVDLGIGALAQDQMAGDVQGPMAEGIMSTVDMGMEEAPPVNFNQGGPVLPMKNGGEIKYMSQGGLGGRLGDIFREKQALYESVAGTDPQALQDQKNMTQAQMLFDIANTALAFASPMPNEPMGLSGAERLALAAQGTQLFDKIGARGQQLEAFKQAQEKDRRALSLGALQAAETDLKAERAAAASAAKAKIAAELKKAELEAESTEAAKERANELKIEAMRLQGDLAQITLTYEEKTKLQNVIDENNRQLKKEIITLENSNDIEAQKNAKEAKKEIIALEFQNEKELQSNKFTNDLKLLDKKLQHNYDSQTREIAANQSNLTQKLQNDLKLKNMGITSNLTLKNLEIASKEAENAKDRQAAEALLKKKQDHAKKIFEKDYNLKLLIHNDQQKLKEDQYKLNKINTDLNVKKVALQEIKDKFEISSGKEKIELNKQKIQLEKQIQSLNETKVNSEIKLGVDKLALDTRKQQFEEEQAKNEGVWNNSNMGTSLNILSDEALLTKWANGQASLGEEANIIFALDLATKPTSFFDEQENKYVTRSGMTSLGPVVEAAIKKAAERDDQYKYLLKFFPQKKAQGGVVGMENGGDPELAREGIPTGNENVGDTLLENTVTLPELTVTPENQPLEKPSEFNIPPGLFERVLNVENTPDPELIVTEDESGQAKVDLDSPLFKNKITLAPSTAWNHVVDLTGPAPRKIGKRIAHYFHKFFYDLGLAEAPPPDVEIAKKALTTLKTILFQNYTDLGKLDALEDPLTGNRLRLTQEQIFNELEPLKISIYNSPLDIEAFVNVQINKLGSSAELLEERIKNPQFYDEQSILKATTARNKITQLLQELAELKIGLKGIRDIDEQKKLKRMREKGLDTNLINKKFREQYPNIQSSGEATN